MQKINQCLDSETIIAVVEKGAIQMRDIKEWLSEIDKADREHRPNKRADLADAFLGELREMFTDDRLQAICNAERDGRLHISNTSKNIDVQTKIERVEK